MVASSRPGAANRNFAPGRQISFVRAAANARLIHPGPCRFASLERRVSPYAKISHFVIGSLRLWCGWVATGPALPLPSSEEWVSAGSPEKWVSAGSPPHPRKNGCPLAPLKNGCPLAPLAGSPQENPLEGRCSQRPRIPSGAWASNTAESKPAGVRGRCEQRPSSAVFDCTLRPNGTLDAEFVVRENRRPQPQCARTR